MAAFDTESVAGAVVTSTAVAAAACDLVKYPDGSTPELVEREVGPEAEVGTVAVEAAVVLNYNMTTMYI